jgi:hypothetical protein
MQTLLEENWTTLASGSLAEAPSPDVVAAIIRVTAELPPNYPLADPDGTSVQRSISSSISPPQVVETVRENLVIGQIRNRISRRRFSKVK